MSDVQPASEQSSPATLPRRGLLATAIGLVAAAFLGKASSAGAEEPPPTGIPILGGTNNVTTDTTEIELKSSMIKPAFCAEQNGNMGMLGNVPTGVGDRFPEVNPGRMPLNLAAVAGEGTEIGVFGFAPEGVGLWAASETNIGGWGLSRTGIGLLGTTHPMATGHEVPYPPAGVFASGGSQVGAWAISESNFGNWGQSNTGIGAAGQSNRIGGWFAKGYYSQEFIDGLEPAALHTTAVGMDTSACFRAQMGVAAMIEAEHGVAIRAFGRIQSDMVGNHVIRRGEASAFVPCMRIIETSHVSITLNGDAGASSFWVEILPGKGAILHLDKRAKQDTRFTWLVVEPAPAEAPEEYKK